MGQIRTCLHKTTNNEPVHILVVQLSFQEFPVATGWTGWTCPPQLYQITFLRLVQMR